MVSPHLSAPPPNYTTQALPPVHRPRLVPRFRWEITNAQAAHNLLLFPKALAKAIAKVVAQYDFDGAVFEVWRELASMGAARNEAGRTALRALVKSIADELHQRGKVAVLVVPPLLGFSEVAKQQLEAMGYNTADDFNADDFKVCSNVDVVCGDADVVGMCLYM